MEPITVESRVHAPLEKVWNCFTEPAAIMDWNAASDDWHTTRAENDLRSGGSFTYRMEAKDGSEGFDFRGTYAEVVEQERIVYTMDDGRKVTVTFTPVDSAVLVRTTFDPETENLRDMQQAGWQAILDRFTKYAEARA